MRVRCHFCPSGQVNSYIVCDKGKALIIDPAELDIEVIRTLEDLQCEPAALLLTHSHVQHRAGIGKYLKVWDLPVYAWSADVPPYKAITLTEGQHEIAGMSIDVIHVPGHSEDSICFHIEGALFTGDSLASGRIGACAGMHQRARLAMGIARKLLILDEGTIVFPGHGCPTSIRIEKTFNHELLERQVKLSEDFFQCITWLELFLNNRFWLYRNNRFWSINRFGLFFRFSFKDT